MQRTTSTRFLLFFWPLLYMAESIWWALTLSTVYSMPLKWTPPSKGENRRKRRKHFFEIRDQLIIAVRYRTKVNWITCPEARSAVKWFDNKGRFTKVYSNKGVNHKISPDFGPHIWKQTGQKSKSNRKHINILRNFNLIYNQITRNHVIYKK